MIENLHFSANNKEFEENRKTAHEHWSENSSWGVTATDHFAIGGSPDQELIDNPNKTLGEIWDIEKIREKLNQNIKFLDESRKKYNNDPYDRDQHWFRDDIIKTKEHLRKSIEYLGSIEKLPEEFLDFEIKDLPNDPH